MSPKRRARRLRGLAALLAIAAASAASACGTAGNAAAATPHSSQPAPTGSSGHATGGTAGPDSPSPVQSAAPRLAGTIVPGAPGCPMFPADNVWNTDISRLPVSSHSRAWLASMGSASTYLHPDFGPNVGGYPYGIPYTIATSAQPLVKLHFQYASESDPGPYPFGPNTPIEGGMNAGGDRHALIVNSQSCTLYELYHAVYHPGGHSTAGSGAIWNLRSNVLRPATWTSADAAGLPILPGLVNFDQVQQAVRTGQPIRHAIRFTADQTQSAFIWPARHQSGSGSNPGLPPMGARFRLKASFDVAGFCSDSSRYCADAKAILVEMQHYGLIVADDGTSWYFQGSAYPQWPIALIEMLKQIPASGFEAVDESCLMVSPNSGLARAKRGCEIG